MRETTNHSIVMLRRLQASKSFVCVYKILHFCANPQKFQTLVPTKNSRLKVCPVLQCSTGHIAYGEMHVHVIISYRDKANPSNDAQK